MELDQRSARTGPPQGKKKEQYISMPYALIRQTTEARRRPPFLPGGKICRLRLQMR
jgi:hypothetical protein